MYFLLFFLWCKRVCVGIQISGKFFYATVPCNSYLSTWFSCGFFSVFKFLQPPVWNAFKNTKNSFSRTVSCLLKDQRLFNIVDLHLNYLLYKFIFMAFTVFWSLSKYARWKFAFVLTTESEWKKKSFEEIKFHKHLDCFPKMTKNACMGILWL